MADFQVLGRPVARKEGPAKATGEFIFPTDVTLPGMVVGRILRSPHPHALIKSIDSSAAEEIEGVLAVVTARNLPVPVVVYGQDQADETILCLDKVRFIGDEVAAVAAIDEDTAEAALEAVRVEYEVLPAYTDFETSMDEAAVEGAPLIHENKPRNIAQELHNLRGDPAKGFAEADFVFAHEYTTSRVHQGYLEANVAVAHYKKDGRLEIWASTQWPSRTREDVAAILGLDISRVRVFQTHVGGGFGGKFCPKLALLASVLSMKCGRPIRIANTLQEDFQAARPFGSARVWLKTGVKRDGTVVAKELRTIMDNGAYSASGLSCMGVACTRANNVYRCKNVKEDGYSPYTNLVPTGAYRGYGNQVLSFAMEREMERIARALGMDPAEFRLKNATQAGDVTVDGYVVRSCGLSETIRWVAKASDFGRRRLPEGPIRYGKGMASGIHVSGNIISYKHWDASGAVIRVNQDGKVELYTPEPDIGQGSHTVLAQIAAEELGVPYEDVHVRSIDTDVVPFGVGAVGSHVTTVGGNGVRVAAAYARRELAETAARMLDCPPEEVEISNGRVRRKGASEPELSVRDVAFRYYVDNCIPLYARGSWRSVGGVDPETRLTNPSSAYSFATHVAEVAVDMETGRVRVVNYWASHDIGRVINLAAAQGQIEGGVAQGIGFALSEEMQFDKGRVTNPDFLDYKCPVATDMPII
ncbi:MAG TPA: xanthine dehydrogenase family protein, partial [Firmicutes bacterium]|nr:xanthine dehydrogenase family protein [Bacillota bacterium]